MFRLVLVSGFSSCWQSVSLVWLSPIQTPLNSTLASVGVPIFGLVVLRLWMCRVWLLVWSQYVVACGSLSWIICLMV